MTRKYTLDASGQPVRCDDTLAWAHWFESADRRICEDYDEGDGQERVRISTVFLGLDHSFFSADDDAPPVLWETLVFGGPLDGEMDRYISLPEAIEGHQAMCQRVKDHRS